jgi:DNA-directed RNA polymerase specialized sigma24 family protein
LSTKDRLVLDLYVQNELPAENVATIVGLPNAKAVYNRVYRALADLRQHLEKVGFTREDL